MCGIFSVYNNDKTQKINQERFRDSLNLMKHRGPDNLGSHFEKNVGMGHVRLSIIDLTDAGNQPFESEDGRYILVYNGEIFNYQEIRKTLELVGFKFRTNSDTEVLLKAYIHFGKQCVSQFNGMWAFAVYDRDSDEIFCSRDRFGIKPLYYAKTNDNIFISSEIKAILSYSPELTEPNYNVIANYLRTSVGIQNGLTWFEGVNSVLPAHNLIISSGKISLERYWDYPKKVKHGISFSQAVDEYRNIFLDAVQLRLRSDVPLGITLSSGIDSTSIASVVSRLDGSSKIKTYTASFKESKFSKEEKQNYKQNIKIDEASLVKKFALMSNLHSDFIEINYTDYVKNLSTLIYHLESGHGSPAIYPLDQVIKKASTDVTVVLEGQGADEMLGGYVNVASIALIVDLLCRFKFQSAFKELKDLSKNYSLVIAFILFIRQLNVDILNRIFYWISGIEAMFSGQIKKYKKIKDYPIEPKGFDNYFNRYLFKSHTGGLVNLLHYGDSISMKHSMESRLPFMDYRLVEFLFTLPPEFKLKNGKGKFIHREAMKGIVPEFILENKIKFGFDSPLSEILFSDGINSVKSILLSRRCLDRGLFNESKLRKIFARKYSSRINKTRFLFRALSVELWFREFID